MIQKTTSGVLTAGGMALRTEIMLSGNIPLSAGYQGACYYNGKIYLAPASATQFAEIDLTTGAVSLFASGTGYNGIVAHPNGFLYAIPYSATFVKKIDPLLKTAVNVGATVTGCAGGCIAQNGKIYAAPYSATQFVEINPYNDTVSKFGSGTGYSGVNLAANGYLYYIPYNATSIAKINPTNLAITAFGTLPIVSKHQGGTVGIDGNIYMAPWASSYAQFAYINTITDTYVTFATGSGVSNKFFGLQTNVDGIYAINFNEAQMVRINEASKTVTPVGVSSAVTSKFLGGTISANGRILKIPSGVTYIGSHSTGYMPPSEAFVIPSNLADLPTSNYNKYFNKF